MPALAGFSGRSKTGFLGLVLPCASTGAVRMARRRNALIARRGSPQPVTTWSYLGFVYGWTLLTDLGELLDRVASLKEAGELGVIKDDLGDGPDDVAGAVRTVLADRDLRPEHRARIYEDLIANRDMLDSGTISTANRGILPGCHSSPIWTKLA